VEPLALTVGYKLVGLIDPAQGAPLAKRAKGVRQSLSETMGLLLPPIALRDDLGLQPSQYAILLSGTVVAQAEVFADRLMAIPSPTVYGPVDGIPGIEPAYGMPVTWIAPEDKGHALGLGYQVVEAPSVIATHLSRVVRDHLPELLRHEGRAGADRASRGAGAEARRGAGQGDEPHPAAQGAACAAGGERLAEGHRAHRDHGARRLRDHEGSAAARGRGALRAAPPDRLGPVRHAAGAEGVSTWAATSRTCCSAP
jgi:hypothetical protein